MLVSGDLQLSDPQASALNKALSKSKRAVAILLPQYCDIHDSIACTKRKMISELEGL